MISVYDGYPESEYARIMNMDGSQPARKVVIVLGNGQHKSFAIAHGLGTRNLTLGLINATTGEYWKLPEDGVSIESENLLVIDLDFVPEKGFFELTIIG